MSSGRSSFRQHARLVLALRAGLAPRTNVHANPTPKDARTNQHAGAKRDASQAMAACACARPGAIAEQDTDAEPAPSPFRHPHSLPIAALRLSIK
jgi:hypothetical protein